MIDWLLYWMPTAMWPIYTIGAVVVGFMIFWELRWTYEPLPGQTKDTGGPMPNILTMPIDWTRAAIYAAVLAAGAAAGWFAYPMEHPPAPPPQPAPTPTTPEIVLPATVAIDVGRQKTMTSTGSATWIAWHMLREPQAKDIQTLSTDPIDFTPLDNGRTVILSSPNAGTYYLAAETVNAAGQGLVRSVVKVVVGSQPPPGPLPPGPPSPPPIDPTFSALQAAYASDTDPAKANNANILQGFFNQFATSIDASLATKQDLISAMVAVEAKILPTNALASERKVIDTYLAGVLPSGPTTALDAATRAACQKAFGQVVAYLKQLK